MTMEQLRTSLADEMQLQLRSLRAQLCQDMSRLLLETHQIKPSRPQESASSPGSPFQREYTAFQSEENVSVESADVPSPLSSNCLHQKGALL